MTVLAARARVAMLLGTLAVSGAFVRAQDPPVRAAGELIDGPSTPQDFTAWLSGMKRWRVEQLKRLGYDGSEYGRPELKWTQSSYMQPQLMIQDRYFFDPATGNYTVDRYLNDLNKRFGGIDAVLIWPTYPNMGIDNRNQFDLFHDMPGGNGRRAPDGSRLSPSRRACAFPYHALGSGNARGSKARSGCAR